MDYSTLEAQYNSLLNNPPKSGGYYNQSFEDRIREARENIDNLVSERDKAWSNAEQAKGDYDSFTGSMRGYSDFYKEAEDEFGVSQAKDSYEKNKQALTMTNSMLEALPSSINATSGRVLTQAQRERAFEVGANTINQTQSQLQSQSNTYEQAWKAARENQAAKATAEASAQRLKQMTLNSIWAGELNNYNATLSRVNSAQYDLANWNAAYRNWQNQQWQNDYNIWVAQLNSATTRFNEARLTALEQRQANEAIAKAQRQAETHNYIQEAIAQARGERYAGGGGGGGGW